MEFDNSLRRQSFSLPGLLTELFDDLKRQTKQLAVLYSKKEIRRVLIMGCGDSNAAAMTMKFTWAKLTKIPVEIVTVIDFSRFYSMIEIDSTTLVIVISVSGNGARIEEAMEKARYNRALTLSVTKDKGSGIASLSDQTLILPVSPFERGPGNRNYFACVLALLLLAVEVGYQRGNYSGMKAGQYSREILNQGQQLEQLLPQMDQKLLVVSKEWKDFYNFDFVGAGDDFVSAWFGHAKIIEAVGSFATYNNSEEWFHMNNFYRDIKHCGTLFFAAKDGAGFSRTKEAVEYAHKIGRPMLVITDAQAEQFEVDSIYIKVPTTSFKPALMLTQYVPACILAGYIGAMKEERNCRGCLGPWEFAAGGVYIKNSERIIF